MSFPLKKLRNPENLAKWSRKRKHSHLREHLSISSLFDQIILRENMFYPFMYTFLHLLLAIYFWLPFFSPKIFLWTLTRHVYHRNLVSQFNKVLDFKAPELGYVTASTSSKAKTSSKKHFFQGNKRLGKPPIHVTQQGAAFFVIQANSIN